MRISVATGGFCSGPVIADGPSRARREEAWRMLSVLERRYSVGPRHLEEPAPSCHHLEAAAAAALRAPDHNHLRPLRFVEVGDEQRGLLGHLFAADAARRGHAAADVERARNRAANGPALLAVIAHVRDLPEVPAQEQWVTVGAGVMNFLNALHMLGFGAKLLSGASVRAAEIQAAFCRPGETLVSWIVAGTPNHTPEPKDLAEVPSPLSRWQPGS